VVVVAWTGEAAAAAQWLPVLDQGDHLGREPDTPIPDPDS